MTGWKWDLHEGKLMLTAQLWKPLVLSLCLLQGLSR